MKSRQIAVAILIIVFLVSIALAASAGPLRAQDPAPKPDSKEHHLIGTVDSVSSSGNSINLLLKSGHQRTVNLTATTPILTFSPNQKIISLSDVHRGDRIAVASSNIAANSTNANLIVLLPPPSSNIRIIHGQIANLSDKSFSLSQDRSKSVTINISSFTICSKKDRDAPSIVNCGNLENGNKVLVVGTTKDGNVDATLIHLTT